MKSLTVYQTSNGYVPMFELGGLQRLESTQLFTRDRGFLLIALLLAVLYCLFFQGLKGHRLLDLWAELLV